MELTTPTTQGSIETTHTLLDIALEYAEPPISDPGAWSVIVDECFETTAFAIQDQL